MFQRMNRVVYCRAQAQCELAPKTPPLGPPAGACRRPPPSRPRAAAPIALIFMGVNREAPSISVHCGRLVGLE